MSTKRRRATRAQSAASQQAAANGPRVRQRRTWPLLIVAAATITTYAGSLSGPFIFDDVDSITNNPYIRHVWPPTYLWSAPERSTVAGRPVVGLSLAVNYALGGLDVRGYHIFNLLVHLLCAALLFGIIRRTLRQPIFEQRFAESADWFAAAAALIWAAHPLLTESVTYVIQRTELLMALFYLLTLYCAIRSWDAPRRRVWWCGAILACMLGMGSKEAMVSAPLIVLLYDRTFVSRAFMTALRRHAGLYAGLAASWVFLGTLMATGPRAETAGWGLGVSALSYLQTQAQVIVWYLRLCFWPSPLAVSYEWPVVTSLAQWALQGLLILALLGATVWALAKRHWAGFLGAWFFLILAPTSSIVPIVSEIAAERRMYLPLIAVVLLVAAVTWWLLERLGRRAHALSAVSTLGVVLVLTVGASLDTATALRNRAYQSVESIWRTTVENCPQHARAHVNLGMALLESNRVEEAIAECRQAVQLSPNNYIAHNALGFALAQQGRPAEAIEQFSQAVQLNPEYHEAHHNLANVLQASRRFDEAFEHYERALALWPDYAPAHVSFGYALAQTGRLDDAIGHYRRALELAPDNVLCLNNLGNALLGKDEFAAAIETFHRALAIDPHDASTYNNLANALAKRGEFDGAVANYRKALELAPNSLSANYNLARTYQQMQRAEDARLQYLRALSIAEAAGRQSVADTIRKQLANSPS